MGALINSAYSCMWIGQEASEGLRIIAANGDRAFHSAITSQKENQPKDFFDLTRVTPQDILPVCRCAVLRALGCFKHLIFIFY
jgi:hypothetical protein